ncbi:MAG: type I restriction endonuclease subunit R, partial [Microbacteriaceae bacterium]|nr:type I restriction endonuclease subunit R [Microbacteriaceae bacterium]
LKYREKYGDGEDKEIKDQLLRSVEASPTLRSKKDLIEAFVDSVTAEAGDVGKLWEDYVKQRQNEELDRIIREENLKPEKTREFIADSFREGSVQTFGQKIVGVINPVSRFAVSESGDSFDDKKARVLNKFLEFFERFFGLVAE